MSRLSPEYVEGLFKQFGKPYLVDDIVRLRAEDEDQVPILAYPKFEDDPASYEYFTGQDLDRFIDHAVKFLLARGFKPNDNSAIALMAPSDLEFIVTFFALMRLGYTVLCLSLRIPPVAIESLMHTSHCDTVLHSRGSQVSSTIEEVQKTYPIHASHIPTRSEWDKPADESRFTREIDVVAENLKGALILHSSGSTGLPKPLRLSHKAILTHPPQGSGLKCFNALPWYHMYGLSTSFQAMWWRKTSFLWNAALPLTNKHLTTVLQTIKPEAVHAVPYVLKLLAETQEGVDELKACKIVTGAGARLPDELGDRLVEEGINLGVVFGATETGLVGDTMRRPEGDQSWNYIRIYANIRPFVWMKPIDSDQYEAVYLKGHPALAVSNSDDPPGSFHSRDVFSPHPTISDVWKYVTRIDDRVTLLNGEKVLPLPIEGRIREDPLVREVAVVGIDKPIPGLLVFRKEDADGLSDQEYLDRLWPTIADANTRAEGFSQITREMVKLLPSTAEYPQTDKGSIIRAKVYKAYADTIEHMYQDLDSPEEGTLELSLEDMISWLLQLVRKDIGIEIPDADSDFFSTGLSSLQATQGRRLLQRNLKLQGHKLAPNVLYDYGNVRALAGFLHGLQIGQDVKMRDELSTMTKYIEEYSNIKPFDPLPVNGAGSDTANGHSSGHSNGVNGHHPDDSPSHQVTLLTGATGSIGAHVLANLVAQDTVERVYCFVRGSEPLTRVKASLKQRGLILDDNKLSKIVALTADPSQPYFSLEPHTYNTLIQTVTSIIHVAWPVNFNIPLQTFEPHLLGLHNLLRFSVSTQRGTSRLLFCSSISTALASPNGAIVPEGPIDDLTHASPMGYGRSKLVGEHMILRANEKSGTRAQALRIGQVVGDSENGIWNDSEAVPMMIRSALTVKALPLVAERPTWVPVDTLAEVMLDMLRTSDEATVGNPIVNLVNPRPFEWTDMLDKLRTAGLEFETVSPIEWIRRMEDSEAKGEEVVNPGVKVLDYYKSIMGIKQDQGKAETGGSNKGSESANISFSTAKAESLSSALRNAPRVVDGDYVENFLKVWMKNWATAQ